MELSLPYDLDNERAVLGACLIERDAITLVHDLLAEEDFYLEKHALIYRALLDLLDRKVPPDLATVAGMLRERGQLELVGGLAFLSDLAAGVPTAVHVEHYANRVRQTAAQRRVIELGGEIARRGYEGGDVSALFRELEQMVELTRDASLARPSWSDAVISGRAIYRHNYPPANYVVDGILPEGTMLLTGKPKTRKSWLALNLAWAVAAGGKALGRYQALQGDVLYVDLEMGERRIHHRLHVISPTGDPPVGLHFATEWPRQGEGFESWMRDYLRTRPYTRLVIVDTLVAIRPLRRKYEDPYESDKRFTQSLSNFCHEQHIAMLLIHHSRKADASDVTDDASGTTGLVAGVDNYAALRLSRNQEGLGELAIVGRDIHLDGVLHLKWDAMLAQWNAIDQAEAVQEGLSPERRQVLEVLHERPGSTYQEIARALGRLEHSTARLLSAMRTDGLVYTENGRWFAA